MELSPWIKQEKSLAEGLTLVDVLKCFGVEEYRAGEARVMKRLLQGDPCILASGGGSFVAEQTRQYARQNAITIWLKADIDVLSSHCRTKASPLFKRKRRSAQNQA